MMPRTFDREMLDAYLTVLEAYDPEEAARIEAAYETRVATDAEIAELLIEALAEHGEEI
jgi:hypothetical protein